MIKVKVIKGYEVDDYNYFSKKCIGETGKVSREGFDEELGIEVYLVEFGKFYRQYIPKECCEVIENV